MLVILFMHLYKLYWRFMMNVNYHQQAPPHLTFASPRAKPNSAMDQELLQCFNSSKVHRCSIKNSPPDKLIWLSNLPILPSTMGLLSLHLDLEQLKDRMTKSSTMSQALCSTIVPEFLHVFKIKLRDSIVWHSQVSQYMWYLWILTKAMKMFCLFLFLPLRLMSNS